MSLLGTLFTPLIAQAGILASLFGDRVYAEAIPEGPVREENSQTIALLEARAYSSVLEERGNKKEEAALVPAGASPIIDENALVPSALANNGIGGPEYQEDSPKDTSVYVIRKNDSIEEIAEMFDISVNTILWANDMKRGDKLVEGEVLFMLPVSGVEHKVAKAETLESIAKQYKAEASEIARYNELPANVTLAEGDKLIVPDAIREEKVEKNDKPIKNIKDKIAKEIGKDSKKDNKNSEDNSKKGGPGCYIHPVPGARRSQGIHDKNAVDLAIKTGTPIRAAASGKVILSRDGYNGGYGNFVIIAHPNGTETLYAHQSKRAISTGTQVKQGQVIGYIGSTGRSTGPHLHFEVKGAKNPGGNGSWCK